MHILYRILCEKFAYFNCYVFVWKWTFLCDYSIFECNAHFPSLTSNMPYQHLRYYVSWKTIKYFFKVTNSKCIYIFWKKIKWIFMGKWLSIRQLFWKKYLYIYLCISERFHIQLNIEQLFELNFLDILFECLLSRIEYLHTNRNRK